MTIWLSGASSGLGHYVLKELLSRGHRVAAGARGFSDPDKVRDMSRALAGQAPQNLMLLPLDVTDDGSVDAFCRQATQAWGSPDVAIMAAGQMRLGAAENLPVDELKHVMDVNFLGAVRLAQKALPAMRAQGRGHLVFFSSINGLLSTPFQAAYSASKHAIEGFCEALAMEVRPFGVHVTVVEPGDHKGGGAQYRQTVAWDVVYDSLARQAIKTIHRDESNGSDPEKLARRLARLIDQKRPPQRLLIADIGQRLAVMLHDLLPTNLFSRLIGRYYGVKSRP